MSKKSTKHHLKKTSGKQHYAPPKVSFEIENDAEKIFLDALENLDPSKIRRNDYDVEQSDADFSDEGDAKSSQRKNRTKSRESREAVEQSLSIDLHNLTLVQAEEMVRRKLDHWLLTMKTPTITVRIITGKGRHSEGEAVLPKEVHRYVERRYRERIVRLDESPAALVLNHLPIRGHFDVVLKR